MTRKPERLKATKLYGSDPVTDKPKELRQNDIKPDRQPVTDRKSHVTEKETQKPPNTERKSQETVNKQEVTKTMKSKTQEKGKGNEDQTVKDELKKDPPKGYVTRTEMEQRLERRNAPTNENQTKQTIPAGFVTRKDMEARIRNRKTKSTKVTPMCNENTIQEQIIIEQGQRVTDKAEHAPRHLFSKLERKAQFAITEKEELASKDKTADKQSQNGDITKSKATLRSKCSKPTPPINKKIDTETTNSKTNPSNDIKDTVKTITETNGSDRKASIASIKSSNFLTPRMTSTAISKAPRQNAKTNTVSGVKLESIKILIMNANGKDDRSGTPAERRKNAIQNVVIKHTPNIVLFQEFSWVGITGKVWAKYPIPEHYVYKGHYEASIMYDGTCITVQDLPASDIDTILSGLQSNANNRLKRTFPMDFNPVARMNISRITAPTKPGLDFVCISWHGRSNQNGGGKMKELKKIEYFEYWMEFLRNIREKYKLPILAAGDYNVDMYSIEKYVESPFKLCIYEASMRRTVRGIVDYCIVTEDLDFTDISWVNLERDTTVFHPNGVLDHDPIVGYLTVSAIGANEAALGMGKKKAWPSPIAKVK